MVFIMLLMCACTKVKPEESEESITPDIAEVKNEITIGHTQRIDNVLPWFSCDVSWLQNGVFEGLLCIKNGVPSGRLAEKWECSADGLTWSFWLKEDVYFSDGSVCDADAVAESWNNSFRHFPGEFENCAVKSWHSEGDNLFVVELKTECYWFEYAICEAVFKIVSPSAVEMYGISNWKAGVGTGEYLIKSFVTNSSLVLERNDLRSGASGPDLTVHLKYFTEESDELSASLISDEIDGAVFKGLDTCSSLKHDLFEGTVYLIDYISNNWWISPKSNEILAKKEARQVLGYFIDLHRLNSDVYSGAGVVQDSIWSSEDSLYVHKEYLRDEDRGNKILAEAGIDAEDLAIELNVESGRYDLYKELSEQLSESGVLCSVNEIPPESSTFPDIIEPLKANGKGHMNILFAFMTQRISGYESGFINSFSDELASMNNSGSDDEFIKNGKELTKLIQDNYAAIPLVQEPVFFAVREGAEEQFEALTETSMFKWMYQ